MQGRVFTKSSGACTWWSYVARTHAQFQDVAGASRWYRTRESDYCPHCLCLALFRITRLCQMQLSLVLTWGHCWQT